MFNNRHLHDSIRTVERRHTHTWTERPDVPGFWVIYITITNAGRVFHLVWHTCASVTHDLFHTRYTHANAHVHFYDQRKVHTHTHANTNAITGIEKQPQASALGNRLVSLLDRCSHDTTRAVWNHTHIDTQSHTFAPQRGTTHTHTHMLELYRLWMG